MISSEHRSKLIFGWNYEITILGQKMSNSVTGQMAHTSVSIVYKVFEKKLKQETLSQPYCFIYLLWENKLW